MSSRRRAQIAWEGLEARRHLSQVIYVDADASEGGQDGLSWASAYSDLQLAFAAAIAGDEIRVADGVYKPTTTGDRAVSFTLKSGVAVLGGYLGHGAANPDARDVAAHPTVLSGDIGTPGVKTDNSHHVVVASGTATGTILDGFTITAGFAGGGNDGGGMYNVGGRPTVRHCTFTGNESEFGNGGAAYHRTDAAPVFEDCTFTGNTASAYGGAVTTQVRSPARFTRCTFAENIAGPLGLGTGGAIFASDHSPLVLEDCDFSGNTARNAGGAVHIFGPQASLTATDCSFINNQSGSFGGAIDCSGTGTIARCTFEGNGASNNGGALNLSFATFAISDCTFTGNAASEGGAIHTISNPSRIENCTFDANRASQKGAAIYQGASSPAFAAPTFLNCVFRQNECTNEGGAIYYGGASNTINCTFVGNVARYGAAAYVYYAQPVITNSTFVANVASIRGGGFEMYEAQGSVSNCIIHANVAPQGAQGFAQVTTTTFSYNNIEGGWAGTGNINANPLFARAPSPGGDGQWGTGGDDDFGDLRLSAGSPCVDAGSNTHVPADVVTDLAGAGRFFDVPGVKNAGTIVDTGAFEFGSPFGGWVIPAGRTVMLPAGGRIYLLTQLVIETGGALDLADNDLVLDYSSVSPVGVWTGSEYDGVTGYIQSGRISSSSLSGNLKNLAVAEAREALGISGTQTGTFAGQSVDSTAVLVKFTWGGDANLDGKINIDDYGRIDGNVSQSGSVWGWFNGDFNYDGKINIDDYGIIDGNINQQTQSL